MGSSLKEKMVPFRVDHIDKVRNFFDSVDYLSSVFDPQINLYMLQLPDLLPVKANVDALKDANLTGQIQAVSWFKGIE